MDIINQKIIDAVIEKAEKVCPGSLALIGIYGSVATGDDYERSDLDLLMLIENDEERGLSTGFILDDRGVGYDIYCTDRAALKYDAECHHAHLSKLMDSQIVYVKNRQAYDELIELRAQAKSFLASEERFGRVDELVDKAKICYANACLSDELGRVRLEASGVIYYLSDAVMLYHGRYFKRGIKRTFDELADLPLDEAFANTVKRIVVSHDISELRDLLKELILFTENHVRREKSKAEPSADLAGTYEEMYSNWRNKVEEAAKNGDPFASFMNMCNLHLMLSDISDGVEVGTFDVMDEYDPDTLGNNTKTFDKFLQKYEEVYTRAGIRVKRFRNVDEFVADYLQ